LRLSYILRSFTTSENPPYLRRYGDSLKTFSECGFDAISIEDKMNAKLQKHQSERGQELLETFLPHGPCSPRLPFLWKPK